LPLPAAANSYCAVALGEVGRKTAGASAGGAEVTPATGTGFSEL
jgi:hypothetical protein